MGARGDAGARGDPALRPAGFRYGAVFLLALTLLVFEIAAPTGDWERAVGIGLEGAALLVVVATSRGDREARHLRSALVGALAIALVVAVAVGSLSAEATFLAAGLLAAAIPAALVAGLVRLVRRHGVTLQAVAGALAIYLFVGLLFAWTIGFVSHVDSGPFFTQGRAVPDGARVYYSFTVLTTTGFGDYTPRSQAGHALAVVEMLVGQLYLVTVIGVLVGNMARRRPE